VAWSKPVTIPGLEGCTSASLAIDGGGTSHVAATCNAPGGLFEVRYASSTDGVHWTARTFARPAHRLEQDAQLAIDGSTLTFASTLQAMTDGGCGDDGLTDVGVYLRTRSLPDGQWSAPQRIGAPNDRLESFRVASGVVHATVTSDDGTKSWYERLAGGRLRRLAIGDAAGPVALRVGDDGLARLAYEGAGSIRFGTVDGEGVHAAPIPGSVNGFDPIFVLEPGNVADVLWNRGDHGAGCAGGGPDPEDGTYFATNAGGTWKTTRLSKNLGAASLTTDPSSGDLIALVEELGTVRTYHSTDRTTWSHQTVADGDIWSATLRVNPANGEQVLAYVVDATGNGNPEVRIRTNG
jgi:hypothetical protein